MASADQDGLKRGVAGTRIAFLGPLAGMSRREAEQLVRQRGGQVAARPDETVDLLVIGDGQWPLVDVEEMLDQPAREALRRGSLTVQSETQLWQQLGLVEVEQSIHRLYTPAMLADLLRVPLAVIRRWHRRGLIRPVREVRRLPYFDFQEVTMARRLAECMAAGATPQSIERQLQRLARWLPDEVRRPLAQLSVIVQGRDILLRQGDGLIEPGGQRRFDFGRDERLAAACLSLTPPETLRADEAAQAATPDELRRLAAELEDEGRLEPAANVYRLLLAAHGPSADVCFLLAELLYRTGDVAAARERYYMAVELDEDFVEARANLGCVLAEEGQWELAIAAFEGALRYHADYPDVHYHLALALDAVDRRQAAAAHWQAFLHLAPQSPWAEAARQRLGVGS